MENRVSIRDIAHALGVHHTTVSLALRNSPLLKKATRQEIQEKAVEMGYKPDPMLSALAAYRQSKRPPAFHSVIGWINTWPERAELAKVPTYRDYYRGALERAQHLGYSIEEFWMGEKGMTWASLQRILQARNISGLLMPPQPKPPMSVDIDFRQFYAVTFGYSLQPRTLHLVTNHHAQTLDLVMSKLVEMGYRRPGYCIGPDGDSGGNYIWISRLLYLYTQYPELEKIPRLSAKRRETLEEWLAQYKPDVVIGYSCTVEDMEKLGYRVPEDIGFASLDIDIEDPRISGANENDLLIGKTAVDLLVGMMQRGEMGLPSVPIRTLVDSSWFPGTTLRPQQQAAPAKKKRR